MRSSLLEEEDKDLNDEWEIIQKEDFNNTSFQCYEKPQIKAHQQQKDTIRGSNLLSRA